ncbi:hypothetical protein [Aquimarina latercula]|nr:hypothetical protein [Aquimarina latercula]
MIFIFNDWYQKEVEFLGLANKGLVDGFIISMVKETSSFKNYEY